MEERQPKQQEQFRHILMEMVRFSIPLILSGMLQQFYNWVDAFIIGNVEGELALGAIGGTVSILNFYVFAMTGFVVGIAVLAGQKYGEGDLRYIDGLLAAFSIFLGILFAGFSLFGILNSERILSILNTPGDTIQIAAHYLRIILVGMPFLAVYNVFSAVLRGVGDSRAPLFSIIFSSVINMILDIVFVALMRLGIQGAAWATVFSQIIMTVFIVCYAMLRHPEVKFRLAGVNRLIIREGFRFSIPSMIQSCVTSSGNLLLQNFMNGFGTATVVAITTAYRIDTLALLPIVNLGSAISTLTAQSYGANNKTRIRIVRSAGIVVMIATSCILTVLIIPFGSKLIALFGAGAEAVQIGHDFFVRLALFYVVFGVFTAMRGYLEGIGDVLFSSIIGILILGIRIICSYLLKDMTGNMVIAYAEVISWVCGLILFGIRMKIKSAKTER